MYRQISDALHGRYGTRKQLMAYALIAQSCPAYLRGAARCIERALEQVPTHLKREVLTLHFRHGLSLRQIAQMKGISYRAVCTQLEEALSSLEQHLAYEFGHYSVSTPAPVGPSLEPLSLAQSGGPTPGAVAREVAEEALASRFYQVPGLEALHADAEDSDAEGEDDDA